MYRTTPDDDDEQDDDDDLQELFGASVQFMRGGKKMRSKTKGWRKTPKGKRKGKSHGSGPSSTNVTAQKTGKCFDYGKYGHWKGDAECDHVKSRKTKSFRPHGANVTSQHFRLDANDDDEDDHGLREAIINSLREINGAS